MYSVKARAAAVILLTLIAGTLLGIGLDRWVLRGHTGFASTLDKRLDLSPQQSEQVRRILSRHRQELDVLFRETRPRVRALSEQTNRDIEALLNPDQREKFRALLAEREARHRKRN